MNLIISYKVKKINACLYAYSFLRTGILKCTVALYKTGLSKKKIRHMWLTFIFQFKKFITYLKLNGRIDSILLGYTQHF